MSNGTSRLTPDTLHCSGLPGIILPSKVRPLHLSVPSVVEVSLAVHEGTGCSQPSLKLSSSLKVLIEMGISQQAHRRHNMQRLPSSGL
jgi:hypothetical protein